MLKHWRVELIGVLVLLGTGLLWAQEQVTLTTYYPSPRGVYREVRVGSGIATTPAARLHVVKPEDDGDFAFRVDDELDFANDDPTPFVIDETGRVGIGTTTPTSALHVVATTSPGARIRRDSNVLGANFVLTLMNDDPTLSNVSDLTFSSQLGASTWTYAKIQGIYEDRTAGANHGELAFYTTTTGLISEKMRIDNNGNVGIGTTNPTELLQVETTGSDATVKISTGAVTTYDAVLSLTGDFLTFEGKLIYDPATADMFLRNEYIETADGDIIFQTSGANDRMVITGAGEVGIGTTTPLEALHVVGDAIRVSDTSAEIQFDDTTGGAADWAISTSGDDALHFLTGDVTSPPLTDVMVITDTGNFGVGTATPLATLHVESADPNLTALRIRNSSGSPVTWELRAHQTLMNNGFTIWNGADRLAIDEDGNVGIGTTSPQALLHIHSNTSPADLLRLGNVRFQYEAVADGIALEGTIDPTRARLKIGSTGGVFITSESNAHSYFNNGGNVGIGTATPAFRLDVAGPAHASSFPVSSDARFKHMITPISGALETLDHLRGVSFEWNETYREMGRATEGRQLGVIAQEVEAVLPELVTTWGPEGYRAVDYGRLTAVLVEAIKELNTVNKVLTERMTTLEEANREMKSRGRP